MKGPALGVGVPRNKQPSQKFLPSEEEERTEDGHFGAESKLGF